MAFPRYSGFIRHLQIASHDIHTYILLHTSTYYRRSDDNQNSKNTNRNICLLADSSRVLNEVILYIAERYFSDCLYICTLIEGLIPGGGVTRVKLALSSRETRMLTLPNIHYTGYMRLKAINQRNTYYTAMSSQHVSSILFLIFNANETTSITYNFI